MFVHHRELIAAESGNEALAVGDLLDPVRDAHQHAVAEHVAQTVVVVLEIVDVDEINPTLPPLPSARLMAPFRISNRRRRLAATSADRCARAAAAGAFFR